MEMRMEHLNGISKLHYQNLKESGMFWSWFPSATGDYELDTGVEEQMYSVDPNHDQSHFFVKIEEQDDSEVVANTGLSVSYYKVDIENPTSPDNDPYTAECNDIIEALNMTYAEANVFKAIWRKCAEREIGKSKQGNSQVYDAEKCVFFSERILIKDKSR